ncbi:MAG: YncE family protein, partial [Phycisphaerales bacterium]|nr:YncE family protein [Phycisphaerales bacterium]
MHTRTTCRSMAMTMVSLALVAGIGCSGGQPSPDREAVGYAPDGRLVTPVNQVLTPHGRQIDLPGMRPQALALSPDGSLLVTAGKTNDLVVIDPVEGTILQRVALPGEGDSTDPDGRGQVSYTGLIFSPDGDRVYMSNVNGSVKVFAVDPASGVRPERTFALAPARAPRRSSEIPSGLAVSADGGRLYVCGNLSNTLLEIDTATGATTRTFEVGVAPYDVRLVGRKAYVTNWGGRRPGDDDVTGPAGKGTLVRVDPVSHIASEGSVSVIDLDRGRVTSEILTGLHASGLAVSKDEKWVVVCNAASDHLSVIDTTSDTVATRIWMKATPAELLGAAPNAATFDADGEWLLVANGSQNAIAMVEFDTDEPEDSELEGLVPVGWYPGAVVFDPHRDTVIAANIKGLPREPKARGGTTGFNSHHYHGSLSMFPVPEASELPSLSAQVARNMREPRIERS